MSRKQQILTLLDKRPRTTAEIAAALKLKVSTTTVHVAEIRRLGLIQPVGERPCPGRGRSVYVWGPVDA